MTQFSSIQGYSSENASGNAAKQTNTGLFFKPNVQVKRSPEEEKNKHVSAPPFFSPATVNVQRKSNIVTQKTTQPVIQKEDAKEDKKPDEPKKDDKTTDPKGAKAETGFIDTASLIKTFDDLVLKLPSRYKTAYEKYKETHETYIFDLSESRQLASKEIMAFWNLSNAIAYKATSPYKQLKFGDSIKIAESLSGASDTYINLASAVLHKDLKKYLADDFPDTVTKNLGFLILTGLLLESGVTALGYKLNKEVDFVTLISPILASYTELPSGLTNPFTPGNIPDPRWKSPFLQPSPTLDANITKDNPDNPTPSLNLNIGLNFASLLSLYPKNDEEKKKYKGLELYPFFNYTHAYQKDGEPAPDKTDKYFAGVFVGGKGVYTLVEGGLIRGPLGTVETYGRAGLTFKNFGKLRLLKLDAEADYRQPTGAVRTRIDSAAEIEIVDNSRWQFIVGGTVGGLLPGGGEAGKLDYGGSAQFYHKDYSDDKKDTYKTGGEVGFTVRPQDAFDASSPQLFTLKAGLVFGGMLKLGIQYDKISGTGPLSTFPVLPAGTDLPGSNVTIYGGFDFAPLLYRNEKK